MLKFPCSRCTTKGVVFVGDRYKHVGIQDVQVSCKVLYSQGGGCGDPRPQIPPSHRSMEGTWPTRNSPDYCCDPVVGGSGESFWNSQDSNEFSHNTGPFCSCSPFEYTYL
jgi:hypothetical protein